MTMLVSPAEHSKVPKNGTLHSYDVNTASVEA